MKKLIFIFSVLTNLLSGQPSCNASGYTVTQVFYPGISSTPSYTPWVVYYLCDSATVYDTLVGGDLNIMINPGATYFWKGGERRSSVIWIKNGGTLNVIPTGNPSARGIFMEPGATVNDPAGLNGCCATISCSLITLPAINCYTGIKEITKNHFVSKFYPNPNNGSFKLKIDSEINKGDFVLMNSLGQKVHEQKISQGENLINSTGLAKGLYHYLILENKIQISEGKIAIE
jgi:hypothetical protein